MKYYIFECTKCGKIDRLHGQHDYDKYVKGNVYKCPYGCDIAMLLIKTETSHIDNNGEKQYS